MPFLLYLYFSNLFQTLPILNQCSCHVEPQWATFRICLMPLVVQLLHTLESGTILGFQYWGGGLAPNEGMTWKKKKSFNILFVYEGRHDQYTAGSTLPIKLIPEY